jgi:uncharacterized membrane protein YdfJ with MMPL/SSD domain
VPRTDAAGLAVAVAGGCVALAAVVATADAAAVLFLSFLSMSTAPVVDVKVLVTGLGAGILGDATVVRYVPVPTLVSLSGRWNWWLPERAARVLRVPPSGGPRHVRRGAPEGDVRDRAVQLGAGR